MAKISDITVIFLVLQCLTSFVDGITNYFILFVSVTHILLYLLSECDSA